MRLERFVLLCALCTSLSTQGAEQDYFKRFYKPGLLQRLVAQNTNEAAPATQEANPPELQLESPQLEKPQSALDQVAASVGISNLVFGGTIDNRIFFPKDMLSGMYMIHVNELFITTNIGDYVSILAEQLLVTDDLGTSVGQDHGFVYATLSNLPFLLDGMAIRLGRMRLRYGIDAKLDAPANPLRTPEYKTIGVLSDRAIEVAGYFGPLDYVAAVAMGADFLLKPVASPNGDVAGDIKVPYSNTFHPIYFRGGLNLQEGLPSLGLSLFYGDTYVVDAADTFQGGDAMLFGANLDQHRTVRKLRGSLDARLNIKKLKLAAEATLGKDWDDAAPSLVQSYYVRADYVLIPEKLTLQAQYDRFIDGRSANTPVGSIGLGITYNINEESWIRVFGQMNERLFAGENAFYVAGTQVLFAF